VYGFLQVYGKKHLRNGETEPAQGPDSGVEDTLSGTVDIDGATDTPKKIWSSSQWEGATEPKSGEKPEQKNDHQDPGATPKQPLFSQRPCYPPRPLRFCLPIAYISVL